MLPSGSEILIILVFVLIFFGTKDLPKVVRTMGRWTAVFRKSMYEVRSELNKLAIEDELKSRDLPKDTVKRDTEAETEAAEQAYRKPTESVERSSDESDKEELGSETVSEDEQIKDDTENISPEDSDKRE